MTYKIQSGFEKKNFDQRQIVPRNFSNGMYVEKELELILCVTFTAYNFL